MGFCFDSGRHEIVCVQDRMMSFKSELLQNRYAAFEKFRTLSPFYDEELASHIFLNFDEVMLTLKEPSLSSDKAGL